MKLGKLHSRKFANAYRILDVFFKMLPTCFTFDQYPHTEVSATLHRSKYLLERQRAQIFAPIGQAHLSSSFCRKSDENRQLTCYLFYQFAVDTKRGIQSRLPCNVLCAGSGFQASCAYILRNKIFVSAYQRYQRIENCEL